MIDQSRPLRILLVEQDVNLSEFIFTNLIARMPAEILVVRASSEVVAELARTDYDVIVFSGADWEEAVRLYIKILMGPRPGVSFILFMKDVLSLPHEFRRYLTTVTQFDFNELSAVIEMTVQLRLR